VVSTYIYIYIYIYIHTHTHTHTHIYICVYIIKRQQTGGGPAVSVVKVAYVVRLLIFRVKI